MTTQTGSRTSRPSARLLPIPAAAEFLGCSEMHVYRLVSTGELRAVDISRKGAGKSKTRIREDDLEAYIDARTRQAAPADPDGAIAQPARRPSRSRRARAEVGLDPSPAA
jgi:excisionase family DNA binding protein